MGEGARGGGEREEEGRERERDRGDRDLVPNSVNRALTRN
jgi:hypothetical protein